jgi:hypothetical protein
MDAYRASCGIFGEPLPRGLYRGVLRSQRFSKSRVNPSARADFVKRLSFSEMSLSAMLRS